MIISGRMRTPLRRLWSKMKKLLTKSKKKCSQEIAYYMIRMVTELKKMMEIVIEEGNLLITIKYIELFITSTKKIRIRIGGHMIT